MENYCTRRVRFTFGEMLERLSQITYPEIPEDAECWTLKKDETGEYKPDSPIDSDMLIEFEWEEDLNEVK